MESKDLSILVVRAEAIGGITATCGDFTISLPAYSSVSEVKEQKDLVLYATRATEMIRAALE